MRIRIKFSKQGEMRFIGHLDLQRFFQKIMRRADIPIRFTEGMSPHMVMSFASPLGVGLTSTGEYIDIEITQPVGTADALERINRVLPEGLRILDWRQIPDEKSENAMALVRAADYTIRFREQPEDLTPECIAAFLSKPEILIEKENKKAAKKAARKAGRRRDAEKPQPEDFLVTVDIRPMIHRMETDPVTGELFLCCACGSSANLKPEDAVRALLQSTGRDLPPHALLVNRCELYAEGMVPLCELGSRIESCSDI